MGWIGLGFGLEFELSDLFRGLGLGGGFGRKFFVFRQFVCVGCR